MHVDETNNNSFNMLCEFFCMQIFHHGLFIYGIFECNENKEMSSTQKLEESAENTNPKYKTQLWSSMNTSFILKLRTLKKKKEYRLNSEHWQCIQKNVCRAFDSSNDNAVVFTYPNAG